MLFLQTGPGGPSWQSGLCLGVTSERTLCQLNVPRDALFITSSGFVVVLIPDIFYLIIIACLLIFLVLPSAYSTENKTSMRKEILAVLVTTILPTVQILPSTQHTFNYLFNEWMNEWYERSILMLNMMENYTVYMFIHKTMYQKHER